MNRKELNKIAKTLNAPKGAVFAHGSNKLPNELDNYLVIEATPEQGVDFKYFYFHKTFELITLTAKRIKVKLLGKVINVTEIFNPNSTLLCTFGLYTK